MATRLHAVLLDRGADTINEELATEPGLRVDLLVVMGDTYRALADYEKAERLLNEALEIVRAAGEEGSLRHAEVLASLGSIFVSKKPSWDRWSGCSRSRAPS